MKVKFQKLSKRELSQIQRRISDLYLEYDRICDKIENPYDETDDMLGETVVFTYDIEQLEEFLDDIVEEIKMLEDEIELKYSLVNRKRILDAELNYHYPLINLDKGFPRCWFQLPVENNLHKDYSQLISLVN